MNNEQKNHFIIYQSFIVFRYLSNKRFVSYEEYCQHRPKPEDNQKDKNKSWKKS